MSLSITPLKKPYKILLLFLGKMTEKQEQSEGQNDQILKLISRERKKDGALKEISDIPVDIPKKSNGKKRMDEGRQTEKKNRKSKISSTEVGIKIGKKYGLLKCDYQMGNQSRSCKGLIIAKSGQKTGKCPKCGRRRKLDNAKLLYRTNHRKKIREVRRKAKEFGGMHI